MMWPFRKREKRASFTDGIVAGLLSQAEGANASANATAALESCAGLYASAFAAARIEGVPAFVGDELTPALMSHVARTLIRTGESVIEIQVEGGAVRLTPAGAWDVRGGPKPSEWFYRLDTFGPSGNVTRLVPSGAVLHFRYSVDPARPWQGVSPLGWASATGALMGRIEGMMSAEAGGPSGYLLPVPADGGASDGEEPDPLEKLKADLAGAKGKTILTETTADAWGAGSHAAPKRDWIASRLGANWPDVLRSTRADVADAIATACNVPVSLLTRRTEGTAQRESLRRFCHVGLEPLGRIMASELGVKLEAPDLVLSFRRIFAGDTAGRVRSLKGMVESGVSLDTALELSGLAETGADG